MRLRNISRADEVIQKSRYVVQEPEQWRGSWQERFGNEKPIHAEIGMGKGQFILTMARENPDINFIGIEKYTSVLLRAVEKAEGEELPNLLLLCTFAENLETIFAPEEISRLYLNFSDPWPKDRHARRRLTSREHLAQYQRFLKPGATLEFKTDNEALFAFSLEETRAAGWKLLAVTRNLHEDELGKGNVMTEYEERFSGKGQPICKLICTAKHPGGVEVGERSTL